jgi:hypothetical protein
MEIRRKLEEAEPALVEGINLVERFNERAKGPNLRKIIAPVQRSKNLRAESQIERDDGLKFTRNAEQFGARKLVARTIFDHGYGIEPQGFEAVFMINPDRITANHHVIGTTMDVVFATSIQATIDRVYTL